MHACVPMHTHLLHAHKLDVKRMLMSQRQRHSSKVNDCIKLFEFEPQKFFLFLCIALSVELLLLLMKWKFIPLLASRCSDWAKDVPVPLSPCTAGAENPSQDCSLAMLEWKWPGHKTCSYQGHDPLATTLQVWGSRKSVFNQRLNSAFSAFTLRPMLCFLHMSDLQTKLVTFSWASAHGICLGAQHKMQIPVWFWGFFCQHYHTGNFLYFKRRNLLFVTHSEKMAA